MADKKVMKNATVDVCANIYFDGKVQSRTIVTEDGVRKTLGVFLPGEYTFGTEKAEVMHVTNGKAEILLPGEKEWHTVTEGENFSIPANSSYKFNCTEICEYLCDYL